MNGAQPGGAQASIRKHVIAGLVVVAVLTIGVGGWAGTTDISSALIAPGSIVVDTNVPALVIVSFLAGLVPTWLILRGTRWQLRRRINSLETAVRSSVASKPENPAPAPDSPAPPQI